MKLTKDEGKSERKGEGEGEDEKKRTERTERTELLPQSIKEKD